MGYINESGIYVYDESDLFAPVHTALNLLGTSIGEKLQDYDPVLPQFHYKRMDGSAVAITSVNVFANIAGSRLTLQLPRKALVKLYFNTWATISNFSSGTVSLRAGVAVSGANSIPPTTGIPDSAGDWGGVVYVRSGSSGTLTQASSTRMFEMEPGTSNFDIQAYRDVNTVTMSISYSYYIVEIVRWLD